MSQENDQERDDLETPQDDADQTDEGRQDGQTDEGGGAAEGGEEESPELKAIATSLGWKEDFQGDPAKKVSAKAFVENTRKVIFGQRDKLARLEPLVERLAKETERLRGESDAQRNARMDSALAEAVESGDMKRAKEILDAARSRPAQDDPPQAVADFKARNAGWYGVDPDATAYAASVDARFAEANGGVKDPVQHMAAVEAAVKKLFPQHFGEAEQRREGERRQAPPANRGSRTPSRARTDGKTIPADLTQAERAAAKAFSLTPEEYCDQLNADREKAKGQAA